MNAANPIFRNITSSDLLVQEKSWKSEYSLSSRRSYIFQGKI